MSEGYYDLAETGDDDLTALWDAYSPLPERGVNDILDAFTARKNITIPSLVKLGTRLSNGKHGKVLAFAYNGGIKYRDMQSGTRWASAGAEFPTLKVVPAGAQHSDTVIVAEGETDGCRLTLLYPGVDVAVLPAGAKRFTQAFADQLSRYDRVILGLDNDAAGEAGRVRIREFLPASLVLTPPDDWCAWPPTAEPPPLPTPDKTAVGTLVFTDLLPAFRGEKPPPGMLVDDLPFYEWGVHAIAGHPGSGKSLLTMNVASLTMIDGRHVVWLDYEQGDRMTGERLRLLGTPEAHVADLFHYVWDPLKAEDQLEAIHARWPQAFVVIDSASKALSKAGLDENSNSEVTGWTYKLIKASRDYAMPIAIIDHVAKGAKDSRYSRGAGSKLADVDAQLFVKVHTQFKREQIGRMVVRIDKDREGFLKEKQWFEVGDGHGNIPFVPIDEPDEDDPKTVAI